MRDQPNVPYGYCHCGCGEKTRIWAMTHRPSGRVKGEPARYVHGHHRRGKYGHDLVKTKWVVEDRGYKTPCWIWLLDHSYDGYGRKWIGGRRVHAHRWAYERVHGPVPDGLQVDHLCFQRDCVNPEHLEPVAPAENIRRRDARRGRRSS